MRSASCIIKPTNTHSQYVILTAFPRQNGYANAPQYYVTCTSTMRVLSTLWRKYIYSIIYSYTGWSKSLCAPDDYSSKTCKCILNSFNHLPW
jgi:hypothetical protein